MGRRIGVIDPIKRGAGRGHQTGKNLHELRDVFRSQWEKSPAKASVAEFLMGHVVDPLEYNKAHYDRKWVRKEYLNALPMLQLMSSGRPFGQVEEEKLEEQDISRSSELIKQPVEVYITIYNNIKRIDDLLKEAFNRWEKPPM